jgi:hypothetical protein
MPCFAGLHSARLVGDGFWDFGRLKPSLGAATVAALIIEMPISKGLNNQFAPHSFALNRTAPLLVHNFIVRGPGGNVILFTGPADLRSAHEFEPNVDDGG